MYYNLILLFIKDIILNNNDELYASTTDESLPIKLSTHASTQVPTYPTTILIQIIKNKNKTFVWNDKKLAKHYIYSYKYTGHHHQLKIIKQMSFIKKILFVKCDKFDCMNI